MKRNQLNGFIQKATGGDSFGDALNERFGNNDRMLNAAHEILSGEATEEATIGARAVLLLNGLL